MCKYLFKKQFLIFKFIYKLNTKNMQEINAQN